MNDVILEEVLKKIKAIAARDDVPMAVRSECIDLLVWAYPRIVNQKESEAKPVVPE